MIDLRRLKDIREDNDISQEEISNILGVNRSTYSMWELEMNIIPLKVLCDFADYFNVSIDYVLGLTNNKNSKNIIKGLNSKTLGTNLRKLRNKYNVSQEYIGNMLGLTQACIARYEKGLGGISVLSVYKLSKEFKVSISELCGKIKK